MADHASQNEDSLSAMGDGDGLAERASQNIDSLSARHDGNGLLMMMIRFDLHSALEFTDKEGKRKRRVENKVPRSSTRSCFFTVIVIFNQVLAQYFL